MKLFSSLTMQRLSIGSVSAFAALSFAACGDDNDSSDTPDVVDTDTDGSNTDGSDTDGQPDTTGGEGVQTDANTIKTTEVDGFSRTSIDAESGEVWAHFSFETKVLVVPTEAAPEFDLAFQRFLIKLGPNTKVAVVEDSWANVTQAPSVEYKADPGNGSAAEDYIMANWWDYDMASHQLSPKTNTIYVVQTAAGKYIKVQVRDYYNDAGTPGHLVLDWAEVEAPSEVVDPIEEGLLIPSGTQYYDLETGALVAETDSWDIKFVGTTMATASGLTDDTGFGGVLVSTEAFNAISKTDTVGFTEDSSFEIRGAGGAATVVGSEPLSNWFDYDMATHTPTPKDQTYIVRSREGNYFKFRILSWSMDGFRIVSEDIERAPEVHQITFSTEGDRYANLRAGVSFAETPTEGDLNWDLGLVSYYFQTNGGTSGAGEGAASTIEASSLEAINSTDEALEFILDTLQTGRGGSSTSYNMALKSWFNYDPSTHDMSAADASFIVRLADGSYAKMKVTSFTLSGMSSFELTLDYVYAGPGHSEF